MTQLTVVMGKVGRNMEHNGYPAQNIRIVKPMCTVTFRCRFIEERQDWGQATPFDIKRCGSRISRDFTQAGLGLLLCVSGIGLVSRVTRDQLRCNLLPCCFLLDREGVLVIYFLTHSVRPS